MATKNSSAQKLVRILESLDQCFSKRRVWYLIKSSGVKLFVCAMSQTITMEAYPLVNHILVIFFSSGICRITSKYILKYASFFFQFLRYVFRWFYILVLKVCFEICAWFSLILIMMEFTIIGISIIAKIFCTFAQEPGTFASQNFKYCFTSRQICRCIAMQNCNI